MSLLPAVTSLNEAASAPGFEPTAYSNGSANPTPLLVVALALHVADELTSASIAAQIGAEDEVPPDGPQPPNAAWYTVTAPVNSSASAETSGTSRHGVVDVVSGT